MLRNQRRIRSLIDAIKSMRNSGMLTESEELSLIGKIQSLAHALQISDSKKIEDAVNKVASEFVRVIRKGR